MPPPADWIILAALAAAGLVTWLTARRHPKITNDDEGRGDGVSPAADVESGSPQSPVSREELAHLARDWIAQAALIERGLDEQAPGQRGYRMARALVMRELAGQLLGRLGLTAEQLTEEQEWHHE